MCVILLYSLSLSSVYRGSTEQSTIAVLKGSGNISEGTLRKLNPFIFSMFAVEELLFSHDNDVKWQVKRKKVKNASIFVSTLY